MGIRACGATAMLALAMCIVPPALGASIPDGGVRIGPEPDDLCRQARLARQAGFDWVSTGTSWTTLEPQPDAYLVPGSDAARALDELEAFLACTKATGLNVQLIVTNAPSWASGGGNGSNDPPLSEHIPAYGPFLSDLAQRVAPYVDAWTPWNEPNFDLQWTPPHDVGRYVALQKAAYPAIKAQDPTALVTSAPLVGTPTGAATYAWDYLAAMYKGGIRGYADVIGFNFYPRGAPENIIIDSRGNPAPWALTSQPYLKEIVNRYDPGRPVWVMETSYATCVNCNSTAANAVSEATQADYLVRMFTYRRRYLQGITEKIFWYNLRDLSTDRSDWFANQGLLHRDFSAKPAFSALPRLLVATPAVPPVPGEPTQPGTTPPIDLQSPTEPTPGQPGAPEQRLPAAEAKAPLPPTRTVAGIRVTLGKPALRVSRGRLTLTIRVVASRGPAIVRLEGYRARRWRLVKTVRIPRSARIRVTFIDRGYLGVRVLARPTVARRWAVSRTVRVVVPRTTGRRTVAAR